jgi:hypothetical protein
MHHGDVLPLSRKEFAEFYVFLSGNALPFEDRFLAFYLSHHLASVPKPLSRVSFNFIWVTFIKINRYLEILLFSHIDLY